MILTRRGYLILSAMRDRYVSWALAAEAVATTAIEHPEWDMTEQRTLAEWDADHA